MKEKIKTILSDSLATKQDAIESQVEKIIHISQFMAEAISNGQKIMIFGNGGSAADAQHIAAEFVNRFKIERPPLAALCLSTDTSILTSIGNDYNFNDIFEKQIHALGKKNDIAWGISTSGNSPNVVQGIKAADQLGMHTLGFTGIGGELKKITDNCICVNSKVTARIQETHITIAHIICELVDDILFVKK